jgi:hypothetical protein
MITWALTPLLVFPEASRLAVVLSLAVGQQLFKVRNSGLEFFIFCQDILKAFREFRIGWLFHGEQFLEESALYLLP